MRIPIIYTNDRDKRPSERHFVPAMWSLIIDNGGLKKWKVKI